MLLIITDEVYDWAAFNDDLQSTQLKLQKLRKQIIRNNTNLVEPIFITNQYYKNVNTPQTIYTWQRVYDSINVVEVTDTAIAPPPYFWGKLISGTKPLKDQGLINSGNIVEDISTGAISINYNVTGTPEYLWFAIPETTPSKTVWYVDAHNNDDIGGSDNLFDTETIVSIQIPNTTTTLNYKIYMTNYPTEVGSIYVAENFTQIP